MKSRVSKRGQTHVPAQIRKKYKIDDGTYLLWNDNEAKITVTPVGGDVIKALRGSARGEGLSRVLVKERKRDRAAESK